jgi:deoxyadenosine/deoxycytidine kinase
MMSEKPFTVFIEGNIASGKSTLLDYFHKFDKVLILKEDVEKWKNFHVIFITLFVLLIIINIA